jgi:hypothetical protein
MVVIAITARLQRAYAHYSTRSCAGRTARRCRVKHESRVCRNQIIGDHSAYGIFAPWCRPTTHTATELVSWVVERQVEKGALSPRDWVFVQRQLAANLVEQLESVPSQPQKSRISSILALTQERDACRCGRDRQRTRIIIGQQRLEADQQGMIHQPLDRQGSGMATAGDCATAYSGSAPA